MTRGTFLKYFVTPNEFIVENSIAMDYCFIRGTKSLIYHKKNNLKYMCDVGPDDLTLQKLQISVTVGLKKQIEFVAVNLFYLHQS
jgi:hypothetical protein